ncbi:hypothetical protein N8974_00790 [bacterium]|nr:hypothetical protein [bacterium]
MQMKCLLVIFVLVMSIFNAASAATKVEPYSGHCPKANGLSKGLVDFVITSHGVTSRSMYISRSEDARNGCFVEIQTDSGLVTCSSVDLYTDNAGDYWVGGVCY